MQSNQPKQTGFTLVEMIVVMVITGIIGGVVAIFIKAPVQGYMDSARRAEMTDTADTALRRLARDIRTAVPNSVRVANCGGTPSCVEFLPTKAGGRYRAAPATIASAACGSNAGAILNFDAPDSCFEMIGAGIQLFRGSSDELSDQIVIGSTQSNGNPPYSKTFAGNGVRRPYMGTTGLQTVVMITNEQYPAFAELEGHRFDVVDGTQQAVTYACVATGGGACSSAGGEGNCTLRRYWLYGYNAMQSAPPLVGQSAILADHVSACSIVYDQVNQRNGLVAMTLGITRGGESISLYHTIHVNNVP
jgi:MSHA biogenesis protein MshO